MKKLKLLPFLVIVVCMMVGCGEKKAKWSFTEYVSDTTGGWRFQKHVITGAQFKNGGVDTAGMNRLIVIDSINGISRIRGRYSQVIVDTFWVKSDTDNDDFMKTVIYNYAHDIDPHFSDWIRFPDGEGSIKSDTTKQPLIYKKVKRHWVKIKTK